VHKILIYYLWVCLQINDNMKLGNDSTNQVGVNVF
jgi:hypothetical protein